VGRPGVGQCGHADNPVVGGMEMKLQEFVNETLREIISGVKEAQMFAKDNGAVVNPQESGARKDKKSYTDVPLSNGPKDARDWRQVPIQDIDFDVAVTSTDASETQAGAGIFVAAFGFGVKDKSDTSNSCVSRIKFSVPIALPAGVCSGE
jgi:hypothetical protein